MTTRKLTFWARNTEQGILGGLRPLLVHAFLKHPPAGPGVYRINGVPEYPEGAFQRTEGFLERLKVLHGIVPLRLALGRGLDVVQAFEQDVESREGLLMQLLLRLLEVLDVPDSALNASQHGGHALELGERLVLERALALFEDLLLQRRHGAQLVFKLGLGDAKKVLEPVLDAGQRAGRQVALDGKGEVEHGRVGADDVLEQLLDQRAGLPPRPRPLVVQPVVVAHHDHDLADVAQARPEEGVQVIVAVDGRQGQLDGVPGHADALGRALGDEVAGSTKVLNVGHDVGDP